MYYAELQDMFARMPFGLRYYWSGRFLRESPDAAIELTATQLHRRAYSAACALVDRRWPRELRASWPDDAETEYGTERFRRLREIKRRYDPDSRFRFSHKISPE
jgi:hypothetical protein